MPSTAAPSKCASRPMSVAVAAARITIAAASTFVFTPCCRKAANKQGPSWRQMVEQDQPEFLHEIERVMIDRLAEDTCTAQYCLAAGQHTPGDASSIPAKCARSLD